MTIAPGVHLAQGSTDTNGFTSSSLDTSGNNGLVVVLADSDGSSVITDSKGNTPYATAIGQLGGFASNFNKIFYFKNPAVGSGHTWTVTCTGKSPSIAVIAFSGLDTSAPLDQTNSASSNFGSSAQPGSVTPGSSGEVVVSGITYQDTANALSIDSGFTISDQIVQSNSAHLGVGLAYSIQTSPAAVNPAWSEAAGQIVAVTIASFKPGAAAAPPVGKSLRVLQAVNRASTY